MLGLGWTEMLVIGIVALVVIGPKDLPVVMNRIGKIAGQIRRMGSDFQREINRSTGLDEVRNLRNSIASPLKKTAEEIRREFNTMTPTGPQPSGIIKPADPKAESVVDEIRAMANMPPEKTADEKAAEYGFKPAAPQAPEPAAAAPVKALTVRKAPVKAKAAPTRPVITTDLAPIDTAPAQSEPAVPRKRSRKIAPAAEVTGPAQSEPVKPARKAAARKVATLDGEAPAPKRRRVAKPVTDSSEPSA